MTARSSSPRLGRPPRVDLDAILGAAESVGLQQLTTTAVAEQLGVSEGTIRHHASSAEQLYALTSAHVLARLEVAIPEATTWRSYLATLCSRLADLIETHAGVESYLVYGPYTTTTIELFDAIIEEIVRRQPDMTNETAWLLGSRAAILTASTLAVRSTRYPPGTEPLDRRRQLFEWTIEAYLIGAETLVADGAVPQFEPTSKQRWARLPQQHR